MLNTVNISHADDVFGHDSKGEELLGRICQSDDLLAQFQAYLKSFEFGKADSLIPEIDELSFENVDSLCNQLEDAYEIQAQKARELSLDRIASALPALKTFTAEVNVEEKHEVMLRWHVVPGSRADSFCLVRKENEQPLSPEDGLTVYKGDKQEFSDGAIPVGVPCYYAVFSCFKGRVNRFANVLCSPVLDAPGIEEFKIDMEGCATFAIVHLSWIIPSYSPAARLELSLNRFNDGERKRILLSGTQSKYADDDVVTGETYRYELTLTVGGKQLEPVVREVTIKSLPELPKVEAFFFRERGLPRLSIPNWPQGVLEVVISRAGAEPIYRTREEYNSKPFLFHSEAQALASVIQSVRRFGTRYTAFGPEMPIKPTPTESRKMITVAIDGQKASFWSRPQYGMVVTSESKTPLPALNVIIEREGVGSRVFSIPTGRVQSGEFFAFPASWNVNRGDCVEVACSDKVEQTRFIFHYLTSKMIP
ncbi:MAG: hypothetical protein IJS08_02635 [Victivallales bacterium]|nr:hypothetical protein [Victivallales bacterium]